MSKPRIARATPTAAPHSVVLCEDALIDLERARAAASLLQAIENGDLQEVASRQSPNDLEAVYSAWRWMCIATITLDLKTVTGLLAQSIEAQRKAVA